MLPLLKQLVAGSWLELKYTRVNIWIEERLWTGSWICSRGNGNLISLGSDKSRSRVCRRKDVRYPRVSF